MNEAAVNRISATGGIDTRHDQAFPVLLAGGGTGARDYIHVADPAAAHVLALEALVAAPEGSLVLNCGYGRGFSVLEVLDSVERVSGTKIARRFAPRRRPGDPADVVSDNRLLLAPLPWKPRFAALDTMVSHALAWEPKLETLRAAA